MYRDRLTGSKLTDNVRTICFSPISLTNLIFYEQGAHVPEELRMSTDSSTNSAALTNSEREDGARSCKSCKIKRLKALFCCVKRKPHKEIVEYDPDEYDYIVEKLVVKRVPLALFAIRADLLDGSDVTITPEQTSRSASSSTFGKRSNPGVSAVAWETISTKTTTDSNA